MQQNKTKQTNKQTKNKTKNDNVVTPRVRAGVQRGRDSPPIAVVSPIQVLNLFLALLLSSFGAESLQKSETEGDDVNKLAEAFDRFRRFGSWVKVKVIVCLKSCLKSKNTKQPVGPLPVSPAGLNGKEAIVDGVTVNGG